MSSSPDLNYGRFSKETMKLTQMVSKTRQTYVMDKSMKLKRMVDSDGAEKYHQQEIKRSNSNEIPKKAFNPLNINVDKTQVKLQHRSPVVDMRKPQYKKSKDPRRKTVAFKSKTKDKQ